MAEAPKDRFRRLIKELAEDDRTFLDTNLLGIYRRGIDYGKAQGFFSDSEATTYRGVADKRIQAIRNVPVLDQQGQPITKTVEVPVIQNGKEVKIKRTTPLSPFDLQKKTGGQMEGGDINGPIYTGRSLGADANLSDVISQRVKLKEQIAPAIQANAREIEQKRGQSALYKPGTLMGLTAGAFAAPFVGATKDTRAAIMRGAGASADQIAREVYTYKQPELDNPFALGVEHAGIFGQTLEEGVLPSLIGTGAGILTGSAAGALAAPTAPFTAGLGPVAAAIAVGMPTAYFATDLAQKGQAAVKKAILGDDVYAARQRQMSEATSANKYGAIAGQMAANFAVATPTLPSLSLLKGGLAAGKTGANIARAERALINAGINPKSIIPSAPLTGMAGRISNSKFYNFVDGTLEGAITSKVGQKFNLDVARGATRGFTSSTQGQEFMSDIAERGIEGMTDLRQAIAQREKDKLEGRPETPLYEIMAQTLFGSLFEGRGPAGKAFDFAGKVGGKIGEAGLRAVGDTTKPTFGPLGQLPVSTKMPSKVTPGMPTGDIPMAGRTNIAERLELPQNIIPMGRGRIAEINREGFTSTVKSVNDLPGDYLDIRMGKGPSDLDLRENVYNAVSRIAPDAGTFARVKEFVKGPAALKAEKVGDSFEQLAGFTDDGFAKISVIKPDGTSTYNTVSVDTLAPANQKKALSAMQEFGIKPSDTTGYVKADVQRDILKNFDLQTLSNPELKNNFQNEFWMGDTLVPGRIVSKVDENHVVMQLPSPTSGVDMIVVPNVNVERMGQPQTIYDTRTIPGYDPSNYSVDKEFHSPIRKTSDRVSTKDLSHPMMLTPEQASRAERARSLIIDKKKDLINAGESAKDIKAKADASIKAATNEMLASTRAEAEYAFDEGTLIEFVDASGQSRMGVVVDNSPYGPVVIDADAPTKPAFIVQESSILKTSVPMKKIPKVEAEPTTTAGNVARRTGRKRKVTTTTAPQAVPDIVAESKADITPTTEPAKTEGTTAPAIPTPVTPAPIGTTAPTQATLEPGKVLPNINSNADVEAVLNAKPNIEGLDASFKGINYETRYASGRNQPIVDYTGQTSILDYNGRKLVVVDINGVRIPFYCSSGAGGKVDVPPGKWYPFFGISSQGWINKTSGPEINSYYGSDALAKVATYLDSNLGDIRGITDIVKVGSIYNKQLAKHIREINTGLSPAENEQSDTKVKVRENINNTIDRLNKALGISTVATTQPQVTPQVVVPQPAPSPQAVTPVTPQPTATARVTPQPESPRFNVREMTPRDIIDDGSYVPESLVDVFEESGVTLTPTQQTMIDEGDIEAVDEGSYLENVQPGDVTVADGDSLVRIRASVEGVGDINEVLAKARNRQELEVVLKDMLVRSGQVKGDADSTTAAKAVAAYYDEMIHAFVNRDLYVAQLVMQDVEAIFPVERKSQAESRQPLSPEPISDNLSKAAKKIALRRNRAAELIQQYDMPRINSIIEAIDLEASSSATLYNQSSGEYFVPKGLTFEDITGDDARRSIIDRVRMKMVADRYKTNIPVFKVIDAGPKLDSAYDNIFEKRGGYTTIVDKRTNAGQQVIFVMANNSDIGTTVHEISHAILDNMPVHMATELATRFGKTLRKPTKLNESYIPYELHEMFATAMEQSFLSGTPPTSMRGPSSGQARLNDIWGKISGFMQKAYSETYGFNNASGHVNWAANRLEWSVPYDNKNVFLWDGIPVTLQIDGKLVRAKVMKTKEKPQGPGLIPDSMINQPMVTVELFDPVSTAIATSDTSNKNAFGSTVVMPSEIISVGGITQGMSPKLGSMMVKWVSGYSSLTDSSTAVRTPIIGLRGTYTKTNDRIMKDNPSGLLDRITDSKDGVIPFVDKIIKLNKDGMEPTSTEWKGYLLGLSNRTMSAANRALNYGLITNIPNDVSHTDYNQWINVVGSLREGQFLKEYTYKDASGKTSKLNTLEWTRAGLKDLANTIQSLEAYTGTLELQNRERQSNAQRGAGNTGGNVLYQSRRRGPDATLRKEAAQRIAGNSNPHSLTPEAFAHYATYDGVPRDVIKQFVDDRVVADAHRTFDGTADIRTLEINDVLVVDGTIDATDTLGSLKKALDFVQRNGIDNLLLHTQAGKTEPLGYSDKGYSVEPSITFTSTDAITDDVYSSIRKQYPAIRISPDRKSVTMTHLEDRGKSYENSLEDFGKAIKQVTDKFIEADVPVQGFQSTERLWNFGNENGRGYAINYDEARNVLNISAPNLFGVDPKPKFDVTVRPTIEEALSAVRGKKVNLPAKFDMNTAPDTLERWVEAGNQFSKLPDTFIPNTDSKRVYPALIKELPKQFKFLEVTVGFPDSSGASKVIIQPDTRVDPFNPLLQNSGLNTVDGKPLKYSEVLDAIYQSIRANVQVVSGGEHSHNLAFAAHASITQDPLAIWGMWSETIGRGAYNQYSTTTARKTGLPPLDSIKTGVVGVDKRIDTLYKDANNQFGHLQITDSNNSFSPATLASGRGVTLFSTRKRGPQSWSQYGGLRSRDFNTHQSPDVAAEKIFTNDKNWELIPEFITQMYDRNSPLFQMFGDNRDYMNQYLKEAVLAKVSMTGNKEAGKKALAEMDIIDDITDTDFMTNGLYIDKLMKPLKNIVKPRDGKVRLYHASSNIIDIDNGGLISGNTQSRINDDFPLTIPGMMVAVGEGNGLGGTPSVVSMTYDVRYASDIAKVNNNFRNVLVDSNQLDVWRNSANGIVKDALKSYKAGEFYVTDRVRTMSGIDNANLPESYKSILSEIANDNHALDMLAYTNGRLDNPDYLVRNNYADAINSINALLPQVMVKDKQAVSKLQEGMSWLLNNQKPVTDVRKVNGINPSYLVGYANWKAGNVSKADLDDMYDVTKEMLDGEKDLRRNAVGVLAQFENNHMALGLPSAYIVDNNVIALADAPKAEVAKKSVGILEYEVDPNILVEHNKDEMEIRAYAPTAFGKPTNILTPDGKVTRASDTTSYKTLWSARPVKPPVVETTTVDDDGTVTVVRTQDPAETSSKVKDALKISKWVTVPYGFVNDLARNSVGGDWSAILIQNWVTANPIENPKLFAQQFMIGLKMMKPNLGFQKSDGTVINQKGMLGREEFHKLGDQLRGNQFYELGVEAGLTLNTHRIDERLAELRKKDPRATIMNVDELGVDKDLSPTHHMLKHQPLQGASERTMAMTKDYIKMMKFTQGMQHYIEIGYNPKSSKFTEVAKDLAGMLNVAQGDVKFSSDKEMDDLIGSNLRNLMFAPRWLASRFMFDPILRSVYTTFSPEKGTKLLELNRLYKRYGVIDPYVRAENNRLFMKSAGMFAFIGFLLSRFNPFGEHGTEVEVKGLGSSIRVGDYVFKAPGGVMYQMEIMSTLIGGLETKPGETSEERLTRTSDQIKMLIMSKAAPAVSLANDMITGRNIIGEPSRETYKPLESYWNAVTRPALLEMGIDLPAPKISNLVADRLFYLWAQDAMDTYDAVSGRGGQYPGMEAGAVAALAFLGGRVRYSPKELKWQYKANDNDNPVPGWEYTFTGVDEDKFFEEQARNVQ